MTYKTILVHINNERRSPGLLQAASTIAMANRAHLIALSVTPPVIIPQTSDIAIAVPSMIEAHRDAYRIEEARMRSAFEKATQDSSALGQFTAEWRSVDSYHLASAIQMILPIARASDLIVASQADKNWDGTMMLDFPDSLATDSGRPVLVIPNKPHKAFAAKRILVAWNGRREATRAVFDALPLLQKADEVRVLWLDPRDDNKTAGDLPAADLCATLARHGVKCDEAATLLPRSSVGETLLTEATKLGWDMLVMGCYGHSRIREFILGGTSRHILSHMTVPVLMSH
ncbi:MAG: universal stress protein [Hyphomicrobiaceae bacterium]